MSKQDVGGRPLRHSNRFASLLLWLPMSSRTGLAVFHDAIGAQVLTGLGFSFAVIVMGRYPPAGEAVYCGNHPGAARIRMRAFLKFQGK